MQTGVVEPYHETKNQIFAQSSSKTDRLLARTFHHLPAAMPYGTAIAALVHETPDCSMSIRLHRRFTSKHHTGGALRHLATKVGEMSGLASGVVNFLSRRKVSNAGWVFLSLPRNRKWDRLAGEGGG